MGFEWNKIFGALLAAAFVVLGVNFLSDGLYHADKPEKEGYALEGGAVAATTAASTEPVVESVSAMLAKMEISEGEKVAKKCVACHTFDKGGANKVGPNLYGTINRVIASVDGFGYSGALKAHGADGGKTWTYDELNGFLYKPKAHVKGTSMGFAGLKKTGDRAAIIAYLRLLADEMAPLPEADAASGDGAATEGETSTEEAPKE